MVGADTIGVDWLKVKKEHDGRHYPWTLRLLSRVANSTDRITAIAMDSVSARNGFDNPAMPTGPALETLVNIPPYGPLRMLRVMDTVSQQVPSFIVHLFFLRQDILFLIA